MRDPIFNMCELFGQTLKEKNTTVIRRTVLQGKTETNAKKFSEKGGVASEL